MSEKFATEIYIHIIIIKSHFLRWFYYARRDESSVKPCRYLPDVQRYACAPNILICTCTVILNTIHVSGVVELSCVNFRSSVETHRHTSIVYNNILYVLYTLRMVADNIPIYKKSVIIIILLSSYRLKSVRRPLYYAQPKSIAQSTCKKY